MKKQFLYLLLLGLLCSIGNVWADQKIIGFTTATCAKGASSGGERTLSSVTNLTVAHELVSTTSGALALYTSADKDGIKYGSSTNVYSRGGYKWNKNTGTSLGTTNNTVGFSVVVADGYEFTIDSISFGIAASADMVYQFIIFQNGDTLYKSSECTINRSSGTNVQLHVGDLSSQTKLQNLTGTFYVRVRLAFSSTGKYLFFPVCQVIGDLQTTAPSYTIILDDNGEYQGNGSATVKVGDASLTISSQASRTGHTVSGYYAEDGCSTKVAEANGTLLANKTGFTDADGKWTATENKRLYAAWEAGKYTLTIVPNEAGYGSVSPTSVANIPYNTATSSSSNTFTVNGTTVTATATDATAEYTYAFSEWTDLPTNVTEDATVTATFTRTPVNYTLAWNANGDGATLSGEYTDGSTPFGTTIVKPTATRTGYVLAGWATTADGDVVDVTTMPAANTTYYAKWTEVAAPTFSVNYTSVSTPQNVGITLEASNVTGTPAPTITWYQSATAVASGGTSKGTGTSYAPAVSTVGTYYFYAVASNGIDPDANSGVITLTVAPKLNSLVYSNGFKAFIQQPSKGHGTITAYYIAGTDAPTISSFTATTDATYNVEGSTLTLTAADEVTTAVFDITLEPVIPFSGTGEYTFTAGDSWVKSGNSFSSGWKIARSYESDSEKKFMVSTGSNRAYLFLAPSTSITVTQNSGSSKRDMYVSIDGGEAIEKTTETFTIDGKEDAAYMVEIWQKNSNGGDGKILNMSITKSGFESGIISAAGWSTFSSSSKLDLSQVTGGTAYVASAAEGSTVTLKAVSDKIVAAGEGLMIKGTANAAFKIATTSDAATFSGDNLLQGQTTTGTVAASGTEGKYHYVFGFKKPAEVVTEYGFYNLAAATSVPAGKAYLETTTALTPAAGAPAIIRIVDEENNATSIEALGATENAVKFIQDGKLYIKKNNVVYDMMGTVVR